MKKTIFVYTIFAFLLTSFAGCGKLKNSPVSGLKQTDTSASFSEADNQSEKVELALVAQETEPVQTSEPLSTSNKDLKEEKILECPEREEIEILERELELFEPKDRYGVEELQAVIDQRNSLIGRLLDLKGDCELVEREKIEILERELKLFNLKNIRGYRTHQTVLDYRGILIGRLLDLKGDDYIIR